MPSLPRWIRPLSAKPLIVAVTLVRSDEPLRFIEIIAPDEFSEFFDEISHIYPLDPADEEALARFEEICGRYVFGIDLESISKLCGEHDLQM